MSIRWDSLLARHAAAELCEALRGARLKALRFDGSNRDLMLLFSDRTLVWRLHPTRGWPELEGPVSPLPRDHTVKTRLREVSAPADERLMRFDFYPTRGGALGVIVELMGNQWNAYAIRGEEETIRHVLWRRDDGRFVGSPYRSPTPLARVGADGALSLDEWMALLHPIAPEERSRTLVREVAWTSPLNASFLLGADVPDPTTALEEGFHRWCALVGPKAEPRPVVLGPEGTCQPYPFPLEGTPSEDADTLMAAFESCARAGGDAAGATVSAVLGPSLAHRLDEAVERAHRRVDQLRRSLDSAPDPEALRRLGDLLLARFSDVPEGAESVRLADFEGVSVDIPLEPSLAPHENADRYYRDAGKAERARARLPGLLREAIRDRDALRDLKTRVELQEVDEAEVRARLGPAPAGRGGESEDGPALPYRVFRSSGGLEIRVGRGARHNDDLTFHHSAPGDVWLHARHTAGAHVILRWGGPGNPPRRDLYEAATLAALNSKARSSGSVPVDWTLRKYVRKPRKAPPGQVTADRLETVFVEPDPSLPDRLASASRP